MRRDFGVEERPQFIGLDAPHEKVWYPVGQIQIVRALRLIARVLPQFEKRFDVRVPAFEVNATRAFALASVMRQRSGGQVGFIAFDLQIVNNGKRSDLPDLTHARPDTTITDEPVTFADGLTIDHFGDFRYRRNAQIIVFALPLESNRRPISAATFVCVIAFAALPGGWNAQTNELVAKPFNQQL